MLATSEVTNGLCRPCHKRELLRVQKSSKPPPDDEGVDVLSPGLAHSLARGLMSESWYWDVCDDNSPFGNDTGADTLEAYRYWRASDDRPSAPQEFLSQLLARWQVRDCDWDLLDDKRLREELRENYFHVLTRDDAVVSLAFAQLMLEGAVERSILERARAALVRQRLPAVMTCRGWSNGDERIARLEQMLYSLDQAQPIG